MKVAACKYPVGGPRDFAAFAAKQETLLGEARARGAQLAVLPEYLALELAATGVTVNAVCPGFTDTDLVSGSLDKLEEKTGRDRAALLSEFTKVNPMGRLIRPEEVADSVLWLSGRGAGAITGQAIAVAGGEL